MKHILKAIAATLTLFPVIAFAAPVSWDFTDNILRPLSSMWTREVRVPFITATSTATSTLPNLSATNLAIGGRLFAGGSPGTSGYLLQSTGSGVQWVATSTLGFTGGGSGTVTSVGLSAPTGLTVSGSPVTTSGTLALSLDTGYTIPTTTRLTNHDTAYSWGNHAQAGYLTSESDPVFVLSDAFTITGTNISNWNTAYGWGNHASAGYLTSFTESDPIFSGSDVFGVTSGDIANWNSAYGWGNHASAGYLTSVDISSNTNLTVSATGLELSGDAIALTAGYAIASTTRLAQHDSAYSWGNHALAGYLTSVDISDDTNLSVSATGLELSGDALALSSGYTIPTTTRMADLDSFYTTPSSRITAGTGLSWAGNTLNASGGGSSNWLFDGTRLTPTTTVGIGVFASSTIGGGTNATGLTINGGATTTALVIDDGTTGTTTIQVGDVGNPACEVWRDADDAGWTYRYALNGVIYTSTTSCE